MCSISITGTWVVGTLSGTKHQLKSTLQPYRILPLGKLGDILDWPWQLGSEGQKEKGKGIKVGKRDMQ